jgi:hypothetical protein
VEALVDVTVTGPRAACPADAKSRLRLCVAGDARSALRRSSRREVEHRPLALLGRLVQRRFEPVGRIAPAIAGRPGAGAVQHFTPVGVPCREDRAGVRIWPSRLETRVECMSPAFETFSVQTCAAVIESCGIAQAPSETVSRRVLRGSRSRAGRPPEASNRPQRAIARRVRSSLTAGGRSQ